MTAIHKLRTATVLNSGGVALAFGLSLALATPAKADDCLLDTNNDGNADTNVDADSNADSGGDFWSLACGGNAEQSGARIHH